MKHPQFAAAQLETDIVAIRSFLTESPSDDKAALIKIAKRAEQTIKTLRQEMSVREKQRDYDQQIFCDELTIEFSTSADFSQSYIRKYEDIVIDCETIKSIIYSERKMQNMSDELLFARVKITDVDPEA